MIISGGVVDAGRLALPVRPGTERTVSGLHRPPGPTGGMLVTAREDAWGQAAAWVRQDVPRYLS